MNYNNIYQLLEKYWMAETTEAEELTLSQFFQQQDVQTLPIELQKAAMLFLFFKKEKEIKIDEIQWQQWIDQLPTPTVVKFIPWYKKHWLYAASLIGICLGIMGYILLQQQKKNEVQTLQTYYATKQALILMSTNINKGLEQIDNLKYINRAE